MSIFVIYVLDLPYIPSFVTFCENLKFGRILVSAKPSKFWDFSKVGCVAWNSVYRVNRVRRLRISTLKIPKICITWSKIEKTTNFKKSAKFGNFFKNLKLFWTLGNLSQMKAYIRTLLELEKKFQKMPQKLAVLAI